MNKKTNMVQKPKYEIFVNEIAHGYKKISSISKIKNKIPTK